MADEFVEFGEARRAVLGNVPLLPAVEVGIADCGGYVAAEDVSAKVDNPSVDVSLMDGFTVSSKATVNASQGKPVRVSIAGEVAAGGQGGTVREGECFRIFTGAPIPAGADAVIPVEECKETDGEILVTSAVPSGRNIQSAGENFHAGEVVLRKGMVISPGMAGMLAATGLAKVMVFRRPRVAVIAVGDELVEPGAPITPGKLYASNTVVISAWLSRFGMEPATKIVTDKEEVISEALQSALETADAIITTGGAWGSERDFVPGALDELGWEKLFGRVKMRPGKGTAFGLLEGKPVFVLPGGPTSCEMAFLQLALPGLLRMTGQGGNPFQTVRAVLTEGFRKARPGTIFIYGIHTREHEGGCSVTPILFRSRLKSMAQASCIITVSGDAGSMRAGQEVPIQITAPTS